MNLILGAGLSGLSCSYHLGHEKCVILETADHAYGHIHSRNENGFTWDEGPRVSFTKHSYVKEIFAERVAEAVGYSGRLEWDTTKPDGTSRKALDSARLFELGWRSRVPLREGLQRTYSWYLYTVKNGKGGLARAEKK
jgi:dTDP-D-glucose 4,6-dehydratase